MHYSTLIIEQNFILNSAFLKILLEILSESNAAIQCCTSSLSHFVYSWQEPRQNADCQSCTGKGMLCSAQGFISCSQLESVEHWAHLRNHLQELGLKLSKPGFYGTMCDECCSWQFFPPSLSPSACFCFILALILQLCSDTLLGAHTMWGRCSKLCNQVH